MCPFLTEKHCCVYFKSSVHTHSALCEFLKYYMLPICYTHPAHFFCSGQHQQCMHFPVSVPVFPNIFLAGFHTI